MAFVFPDFLSTAKRKILVRRAKTYFTKPEDREDFIQTAIELALEKWILNGRKLFNGEPDIDAAEYLAMTARKKILRIQSNRTESRGGEILLTASQLDRDWFDGFSARPLGRFLDRCVPVNQKDRISLEQVILTGENGNTLRMTYDELSEFTGYGRNSIGRIVKLGRPIRGYIYDGKLYPSLKRIEEKFEMTEAAARWRSRAVKFRVERG